MLTEERRGAIISLLHENGKVQVKDLSRRFNTSEVTIRTDLKELHHRGLLFKSHGGAVLPNLVAGDRPLFEKSTEHAAEKARIGAAAAPLIKDGETVILDSGTTTHEIAKLITDRQNLTVITNGINVATELAGSHGIQIILLGGVTRHNSLSTVGHFAEEMLSQLTADKLFMGADGCTIEFGISTPRFEESRINQAMLSIAREKYLVTDSSKFGKNSLSRISSLWEMTGVITDTGVSEEYKDEIIAHGLELIVA